MVMQLLRLFYKTLLCVTAVLLYIAATSVIFFFPLGKYSKKNILAGVSSFTAAVIIKILNVKALFTGSNNYSEDRAWYIMVNHVSFVDVFLVIARFRTFLITSTDMRKRAVLGQLSVLAGCLFVERRKITTLKDEIPEISGAFRAGLNVCLFPESTCGDGKRLLPFKSALMSAVSGTGAGILPVCVMYKKIDGRKFTADDFNRIGYFGGMKFAPQFIKVMMLKSLEVELEMLEPFDPENLDRKEIGERVFSIINTRYENYLSDMTVS